MASAAATTPFTGPTPRKIIRSLLASREKEPRESPSSVAQSPVYDTPRKAIIALAKTAQKGTAGSQIQGSSATDGVAHEAANDVQAVAAAAQTRQQATTTTTTTSVRRSIRIEKSSRQSTFTHADSLFVLSLAVLLLTITFCATWFLSESKTASQRRFT